MKVSRSCPKHFNKPALFKHSTVAKKKNFRRTAANVGKDVHSIRPDLKVRHCLASLQYSAHVAYRSTFAQVLLVVFC